MNINFKSLSVSQVIKFNPVVNTDESAVYFRYLQKYVRMARWQRKKSVKAEMKLYSDILVNSENYSAKADKPTSYYLYIPFDMCAIAGYNNSLFQTSGMKAWLNCFFDDHNVSCEERRNINALIKWLCGDVKALNDVKKLDVCKEYISAFKANMKFLDEKPFKILVAATMSAGKSTFINAVTGKNVNLSQNLACTGKIHAIVSKPYDDDFTCEYDHDIVMNAGSKELLNDNDSNNTDKIYVSTYYNGRLGGQRIIVNDSPGINFSGNATHKVITDKMVKDKNYDMLLYLINSTQMGTNDDADYLKFIKKNVKNRPVIFVVNKIDNFDPEEEDFDKMMKQCREYLVNNEFENPVICPVSAKAGFMAKQGAETASKQSKIDNFICDFNDLKVTDYYKKNFPDIKIPDSEDENEMLVKSCGLAYLEEIIKKHINGGKK